MGWIGGFVMTDRKYCKQPDRHQPKLTCGYPLPCPYHTILIRCGDEYRERWRLRRLRDE